MFKKHKNKKAFTLIELIVVMSVIGILVLLAMPKFMGYTEKARLTEIKSNIKQLENASERYYIDIEDWPRVSDKAYTAEQLEAFTQEIMNRTGAVVTLDPDGSYYPISYKKLQKYVQEPKDGVHYILQNPVGEVFYLEGLKEESKIELSTPKDNTDTPKEDTDIPTEPNTPSEPQNRKPTAVISMSPSSNLTNTTDISWNFNNSTDPDGDKIVATEWQLDSDPITTSLPNGHIYKPGSHTMKLRVQDEKGMWSDWTSKTFSLSASSLSFNGTNARVSIPSTTAIKPTSALTVEVWAYMSTWTNAPDMRIVSTAENGGYFIPTNYIWKEEVPLTNKVGGSVFMNGQYKTPAGTSLNSLSSGWHHFAFVTDGRYVQNFVDGKLISQVDLGATYKIQQSASNIPLTIGAEFNPPDIVSFFKGNIRDVRVWSVARTSNEIKDNMYTELSGTETGLQGYWKLNENSGSIAYDSSVNKNNGTIYNGTWGAK